MDKGGFWCNGMIGDICEVIVVFDIGCVEFLFNG